MFREADRLIRDKRTIVDSPTDETSEGKRGVEHTVGGIRQSDVLKAASSQVGHGREHPDGGEAKSSGMNQRKSPGARRLERRADQVIPTNTTWVIGDLSTGPWVSKLIHGMKLTDCAHAYKAGSFMMNSAGRVRVEGS